MGGSQAGIIKLYRSEVQWFREREIENERERERDGDW